MCNVGGTGIEMNDKICKVSCDAGTIKGRISEEGISIFKGIPYACPPVGELRWKPPVPAQKLDDFEAYEFGDIPCQNFDEVVDPMNFGGYEPMEQMSEDCLTLNIWTKGKPGDKKPVLFWIYGGAFIKGYGRSPQFDGRNLVENEDIVLVTINHREGLLATMNFSSIDPEGEYRYSNNLYIMDQIQALRWCHENIAAFGGDPENVTLYGHSSGSNSVTHLLLSRETGEYYKKAICQSSFFTGCGQTSLEWSRKISDKVLELLSVHSKEELKTIPVERILEVQKQLFTVKFEGFKGKLFSPVPDGLTVPEDSIQEILGGRLADKIIMLGCSDGEYDQMFMREPDEEEMLRVILSRIPENVTPDMVKAFTEHDPERTRKQAYLDIYNEFFMHSAEQMLTDALVKGGSTCYQFWFKWWEDEFHRRAPHGAPSAFVFGNKKIPSAAPEQLRRQVQHTWGQFLRTGDPNHDGIPHWDPHRLENKACMLIDVPWHQEMAWHRKDYEVFAPFFQQYHEIEKAPDRSFPKSEYDGSRYIHRYVEVEDGTKLSVVIHIPTKNKVDAGPLPVVMQYTPYDHLVYKKDENGETVIAFADSMGIRNLLPYGYVVVFAHVRGCGASFGVRKVVCSRQEAKDGAFIVEWLAKQSFCNGKVMTAGQSYNGQTQLEIISQKPEHLVASYIGKTDFNRYDGWVRNGIPRAFGSRPDIDWGTTEEEKQKTVDWVTASTVPVDGDEDRVLLHKAIEEHLENGTQTKAQRDYLWRDSYSPECDGEFWNILSASTYVKDINDSGVAVYLDGGTQDVFKRDTIMLYHNLTLNKKLIFGPWDHVGPKKTPEPWTQMLRWADYWLKDIENGVMAEKPITLRVVQYDFENHTYQGDGTGYYRRETQWPLHEGRRDTFYLSEEPSGDKEFSSSYLLSASAVQSAKQFYRAAYGVKSSVESNSLSDSSGKGAAQLGLNYFTEPFRNDTEYIGHPIANLTFVLDDMGNMDQQCDLDFFISLSDYDPERKEMFQFGNGWLRSSLRKESPNCPYDFLGLPWHENKKGDNEYLKPGETYQVTIDLTPVFYRIRKGHSLMVTITNSMDRTYYAGRSAYEENPDTVAPGYHLVLGGKDGCQIVMPDIYDK